MLVGATPNASRAAAGTPHDIVNTLFPQQIESFRACGQGLRVDFDTSDSDEDIGDEESDAVCDMAREWFLDIVGHHNSEVERRSSRRTQDLSVTHHISLPITSLNGSTLSKSLYMAVPKSGTHENDGKIVICMKDIEREQWRAVVHGSGARWRTQTRTVARSSGAEWRAAVDPSGARQRRTKHNSANKSCQT